MLELADRGFLCTASFWNITDELKGISPVARHADLIF